MNLNMEGTKHEKAVLVILSYVVGFTAGFITFGVTSNGFSKSVPMATVPPVVVEQTTTEMETVVPDPEMPVSLEEVTSENSTDQVHYTDGRLMANVNGASVLLSAQLATVDAETAKLFAAQGVHEAIPKYTASADGAFIYYCEQHSAADSCINFVYDSNAQIIHYVTVDGAKLVTPAATAESATWNNETLTVGTASSIAANTPWKLVSAQ
jgi:hypothetical protein